jgi:tight adherence protein B
MPAAYAPAIAASLAMAAVVSIRGWLLAHSVRNDSRRRLLAETRRARRLAPRALPALPVVRLRRLALRRADVASALNLRSSEYWGLIAMAAGLGLVLGFLIRGLAGALVLGAVMGVGLGYFFRWRRREWLRQAEAQLPEFLRGIGTAMQAGSSLAQALAAVGTDLPDPLGAEIRRLGRRGALGVSLSETLEELASRVPSRDLDIAVSAIQVQREVGGPLGPLLDDVVETVEARQHLRAEVRVLTAMGRASGMILSIMPIGVGLIVWFMNPAYMDVLFTSSLGHILLGYSVSSLIIGTIVMNRMVQGPSL